MAEESTKYIVSVSFDTAMRKLTAFDKKMSKFENKQTSHLLKQISLQAQLNRLRESGLQAPPTPANPRPPRDRDRDRDRSTRGRGGRDPWQGSDSTRITRENSMFDPAPVDRGRERRTRRNSEETINNVDMNAHLREREKFILRQGREKAAQASKEARDQAALLAREQRNLATLEAQRARDRARGIRQNSAAAARRIRDQQRVVAREAAAQTRLAERAAAAQARATAQRLRDQQRISDRASASADRTRRQLREYINTQRRSAFWQDRIMSTEARRRIIGARSIGEARNLLATQRQIHRVRQQELRVMRRQNFLMSRMRNSSRQMAGNMISVFALGALGAGITKTGQDFESVGNTMLAVSTDARESGENFKFVREEAYRLGLGLKQSAKGFAKMVSARGEMSLSDTKALFSGTAEMGTLLGLTAEESGRATNAIQQMMSKGVVSAEELKLQLGEVLPNAIQIMAKSAGEAGLTLNGTVKEMLALQQAGGLISSKVLPVFAKNMSLAAKNNGGLEAALLSNRVAMNRMMFSFAEAAETIFNSDFGVGLTDLFNTMAESIKNLTPLWIAFGRIFGSVFRGLARIVEAVTPTFIAWGENLEDLTDQIGEFSAGILLIVPAISLLMASSIGISAVGIAFRRILAPILLVMAAVKEVGFWMEEVANLNSKGDKIGLLYDPRVDKENDLYDPEFAKTPDGLRAMHAIDEKIARANEDDEGNFSFNSVAALPFNAASMIKAGVGKFASEFTDSIGLTNNGAVSVNVTFELDGKALGENLSRQEDMIDMATRIAAEATQ